MKTLLIVDDEEDICEIVAINLEEFPLNILLAYSGQQALKMMAESAIDFVISDIQMPQMNGVELFAKMKELYKDKNFKHIFMSGFADLDEKKARELGSLGLISKPIDMNFLCNLVKKELAL